MAVTYCGSVALTDCGSVALTDCGSVALTDCGSVALTCVEPVVVRRSTFRRQRLQTASRQLPDI